MRPGRPPKELASDVEDGFSMLPRSSFSKKASKERASTRSPRWPRRASHDLRPLPGKEALFAAVVARIINGLANFDGYTPEGRTVPDKLTSLGTTIAERAIEDSVALMRATIAEAQRFPALSRDVHEATPNSGCRCCFPSFEGAIDMRFALAEGASRRR